MFQNLNEQTYQSTDIWLSILTFIDTGAHAWTRVASQPASPAGTLRYIYVQEKLGVQFIYMPCRVPAGQPGPPPQDLVTCSYEP